MAVISLFELKEMEATLREVVLLNNTKTKLVTQMSESIHVQSRVMRTITLLDDSESMAAQRKKLEVARAEYHDAAIRLYALPTTESGQAIRDKIKKALELARIENDRVLDMAAANEDEAAVAYLLRRAGPATQLLQDALHENANLQEAVTAASFKEAEEAYATDLLVLGGLTSTAVLFGTATAIIVSRSITTPITAAVQVARTVASGDLTSRIERFSRDETGELLFALREMNDGLVNIVTNVRAGAENITTAACEISDRNLDLSRRTEQQASSLEETAASTEQLAETTRQNALSARRADELAVSAADSAKHGSHVVEKVVSTMENINVSARKIEQIIAVIDGIAFQTNILALNAAVEAARAGEQGRGFAVVASEVRTLAQSSASAAKDIKLLIDNSVLTINKGSELVRDAGESIRLIVEKIESVSATVKEIALASAEQASRIGQVSIAVSDLERVTQQNAAQVEEGAGAAESLRGEAIALAQTVSTFKLGRGSQHARKLGSELLSMKVINA